MANKKCEQCKKDYECTNTMGHEQKYCSHTCRNKAANNRRIDKIKNEANEKEKRPETFNINTDREQDTTHLHNGNANSFNYFKLLESKYQTMNENNFHKLKIESLEKELNNMRSYNLQLEGEMDDINERIDTIGKVDNDPWGIKKMIPILVPELFKIFVTPKVTPLAPQKFKTEV